MNLSLIHSPEAVRFILSASSPRRSIPSPRQRQRDADQEPGALAGGSPAILLFLEKGSALSAVGSFSLVALGPGLKNSCGVSYMLYQEKSLTSPFLGGTLSVPSATRARVLSSTSASCMTRPPVWGRGVAWLCLLRAGVLLCHPYLPPPAGQAIATRFSNKGLKSLVQTGYLAC